MRNSGLGCGDREEYNKAKIDKKMRKKKKLLIQK
jgi:hypothetical protein